jgi:hypothetical protein
MARYHLFVLRDSIILSLRVRQKSVAGAEYAPRNTGGSIIRGNSGNGALPTLNGESVGNKNIAPNDSALLLDCRAVGHNDLSAKAKMPLTSWANRRFQFHKRGQLFICVHDKTLSVVAMASAIQIVRPSESTAAT